MAELSSRDGRRRPIIGIMGAAQASSGSRRAGVMAAACAGAKQVRNSLTLGVLPGAGDDISP